MERSRSYWGINQSVSYGTDNIKLLDVAPGFVDTGCTWLLFATEAFKVYEAKTGGIYDKATKLLTITETQYENLQSLNFEIGGVTYELTRNAQIWPRKLNTLLEGGQEGKFYLIVMDLGTPTGSWVGLRQWI
ncbi:hypothetical protein EDB19DRAFT_209255 [Suillus lakei]|nr:hypothetical protein EDB19DRAFT_209255 [Suillus lakei]